MLVCKAALTMSVLETPWTYRKAIPGMRASRPEYGH
jgi:hypothetical protein